MGIRASTRISAASLPGLYKKPGYHADGNGLYLHVISPTSRSWCFRYMRYRKQREMGLGSADDWTLSAVRERVGELRRLLRDGVDPLENRRQEKAAEAHTKQEQAMRLAAEKLQAKRQRTFDQCATEYLELHNDTWKNKKHQAQWKSTLEEYASPKLGKLEVGAVTTELVQAALKKIWTTKAETASRVLQRIDRVLVWATAKGYRTSVDAAFRKTVAAGLGPQNRKVEHMAACPYPQVFAVVQAVHASDATSMVKRAFEFTILTAARSGETRGALWSELDLEAKVWSIPAERMKAGRPHDVPLSDRAVLLLKLVAPLDKHPKGLVFPAKGGQPFSDMVFTQLLRRLGFAFTLLGFRSTFRDWAAEQTDFPPEVCEAALAHTTGNAVERAYKRSNLLERRVPLMADWAKHIEHRRPLNP